MSVNLAGIIGTPFEGQATVAEMRAFSDANNGRCFHLSGVVAPARAVISAASRTSNCAARRARLPECEARALSSRRDPFHLSARRALYEPTRPAPS
jgi:hypothetical protein